MRKITPIEQWVLDTLNIAHQGNYQDVYHFVTWKLQSILHFGYPEPGAKPYFLDSYTHSELALAIINEVNEFLQYLIDNDKIIIINQNGYARHKISAPLDINEIEALGSTPVLQLVEKMVCRLYQTNGNVTINAYADFFYVFNVDYEHHQLHFRRKDVDRITDNEVCLIYAVLSEIAAHIQDLQINGTISLRVDAQLQRQVHMASRCAEDSFKRCRTLSLSNSLSEEIVKALNSCVVILPTNEQNHNS